MGSVYIDGLEERAYGMGLGRATIPGRHTTRTANETCCMQPLGAHS